MVLQDFQAHAWPSGSKAIASTFDGSCAPKCASSPCNLGPVKVATQRQELTWPLPPNAKVPALNADHASTATSPPKDRAAS